MTSFSKTKNKEKCIKCSKTFLTAKNRFKCDRWARFLHHRCSKTATQEYFEYKQGVFKFICQLCADYICIRCARHVYYGYKAVLCNGCEKFQIFLKNPNEHSFFINARDPKKVSDSRD